MEHYDFIAIDFETANRNYDSACSIGLAVVKDLEVVATYYSLINPETAFDPNNIKVHGITQENVKDAPTASDLWKDISCCFGPYAVLAHNAYFDMCVLKRSFPFLYDIDFKYIDTVSLCKEFVPGKKSLANCADFFNIDMGQHHNGLDDAVTCAKLAISCIKGYGFKNLGELCFALPNVKINQFADLDPPIAAVFHKPKAIPTYGKIRPRDVQRDVNISSISQDNFFFGKSVVFTGELRISREEAMQTVVNLGGIIRSSVSRKTNCLIVGEQDLQVVGATGLSTKERKALELNETGAADIKIINESQFWEILQGEVSNE